MNKLRQIALTVRQPGVGQYEWVLIEQLDDGRQWTEFSNADCPYPTYREAIAAGLMMLAAIIADFDTGPRAAGVEAPAPTVASHPDNEDHADGFLDRPARGPTAESETARDDAYWPLGPDGRPERTQAPRSKVIDTDIATESGASRIEPR